MIRKIDATPLHLPPPGELMHNCRGAAVLDSVLEPEWLFRYFSFAPSWGPDHLPMASMRNGEADHWHYIADTNTSRAFLKGYFLTGRSRDINDLMAERWREVVPAIYHRWLMQPAFYVDETTHCFWWNRDGWNGATAEEDLDPAGLRNLLVIAGGVESYGKWAEDYYEVQLDPQAVAILWNGQNVSMDVIQQLNGELHDFAELSSYGITVV